jgi:hypothetical protein
MNDFDAGSYSDDELIFAIGDLAENLYLIEKSFVELINA